MSDLRKGDRFTAAEPIVGSFNGADVSVVNVSMGGAQIVHAQPIRIGTRSRLAFHRGQTIVSVPAQVVWSHLSQTNDGNTYRSGVRLDVPDVLYAAAINAMFREHVVERDTESLERKRLREMERELRRKSGPRIVATPGS
ncbi:MAG TPA: PilZ domain-containing protein [Thermoanaerobaculia bacterium]|nr:PilZ domain-containing protein [Thermoanaerobaculia bacterium]